MKKKSILVITLLIIAQHCNAQIPWTGDWLIGGNVVTTGSFGYYSAPGTTTGTLGDFGSTQYTCSDMRQFDEARSFYIRNYKVYDFNGVERFELPDFRISDWCHTDGSNVTGVAGELSIVPRPGVPDDYYIIYDKNFDYCHIDNLTTGTVNTGIYYVTIRINSSTHLPELVDLESGPCSGTSSSSCSGSLPSDNPHQIKYFYGQPRSVSFTVSKAINEKNDRYLFICGHTSSSSAVTRFLINNSGISSETTTVTTGTISSNTLGVCDFNSHNLTLSPDQHFIAWCADLPTSGSSCSSAGSSRPIYVLPLLNYAPYPSYSFTNEIYKISNSTEIGGLCFSQDSRYLIYTTDAGLKYSLIADADPLILPTPSTVSSTTDLKKSHVARGGINDIFAIDASTETFTHFAWPSTTPITSSIPAKGNHTNNYNSTYRLPKEYNFYYQTFNAFVDINTRCVPGYSTPSVAPTFSVTTTNVGSSYFYNWYPLPGNTTTLDDYHSANPKILTSSTGHWAYYYLTVLSDDGRLLKSQFVSVHLTTSADWDLASRDSKFDLYDEPNTQATVNPSNWNIWLSPDIWNRVGTDGMTTQEMQNPVFHLSGSTVTPNNMYVKVRNVGCVASPSTGREVRLYWTAGGGPETWNPGGTLANYWTNKLFFNVLTTPIPHGLEITTPSALAIPSIDPGDFVILTHDWTPPNPTEFTTTAAPVVSSVEICFLARIVDGHSANTDGMTVEEDIIGSISNNVRNNNNIVTLNSGIEVILGRKPSGGSGTSGSGTPPPRHVLTVANAQTSIKKFSLQLANEKVLNGGASTLSEYMNVKIYLGDLYDIWRIAGAYGTYLRKDDGEKSVTFDGSTTMQLDSVNIDTGIIYALGIEMYIKDDADGEQMPEETIHFRQMLDGEVYGGYTWTLKYDPQPSPTGVLAVTEISQGPSSDPGCEYAEILVGNCGGDASAYVNVEGWIIDDNVGNFSNDSCDSAYGITRGHYRLVGNIWRHIPTGSVIMVYNESQNCYDLPSTFTADENNHIYWLPVSSSASIDPVLERYNSNEDICTYCANEGSTEYAAATNWANIIDLHASKDAVQVRCPGCTDLYPGTPAFYHGIGYGASSQSGMTSISSGSHSLGGPVVYHGGGTHKKYEFTGTTGAQLGNPLYWSVSNADAAGSAPSSAGYVDEDLFYAAFSHGLDLPCCYYEEQQERTGNNGNIHGSNKVENVGKQIKVYPNPASTSLYFEYPQSHDVEIRITDMAGRVIYQKQMQDNMKAELDVKEYAPGLYLYHIVTDGQKKTGKIVIK